MKALLEPRDGIYIDTRNALLTALLLVAVAGTWYLGHLGRQMPAPQAGDAVLELGYYLRNAVLLGTNDEGQVVYRISAARVAADGEEADEDGRLALETVTIDYRDDQDVAWQISAGRAAAARDADVLELRGGVRVQSTAARDGPETVIEAEQLSLEPERYLARTPGEVTVNIGAHRLSATGLTADLRDDRLELESRVHGQFRN